MSKIVTESNDANNSSLLACLVLVNEENGSVVSGCGSIPFPVNDEPEKVEFDATSTNLTLLHASLDLNRQSLSVFFRVEVSDKVQDSCKLILQVKDADVIEGILAQQSVPCSTQKFHFQQMSFSKQNFYEVCAKLETDESFSKCVTVERDIYAKQTSAFASSTKKEPILPLVLTLVFLAIGIAVLVVIYLVVKGYLSERHRPGLVPDAAHSGLAGKVIDSLVSSLYWTCHLFSWKHRRRRRRDHLPVDQVDEISLQDNVTVTSFISDWNKKTIVRKCKTMITNLNF